jgi:hypothetical protein
VASRRKRVVKAAWLHDFNLGIGIAGCSCCGPSTSVLGSALRVNAEPLGGQVLTSWQIRRLPRGSPPSLASHYVDTSA